MKITVTSVLVDDQAKALSFYTDVLGFATKNDIPLGEHRWLTASRPTFRTGSSCCASPMNTRPRSRSRLRWSRTVSPPHRSASRTSSMSTSDCAALASASRRSPRPWGQSPPPCSTTPAETSSRSPSRPHSDPEVDHDAPPVAGSEHIDLDQAPATSLGGGVAGIVGPRHGHQGRQIRCPRNGVNPSPRSVWFSGMLGNRSWSSTPSRVR